MEQSYVKKFDGGSVFVGRDATALLHARTVMLSLSAIMRGFRLTRTATPTRTLALASKITGKTYKRGRYAEAHEDVRQWALAMEAALPVIRE